MSTTQWVAWKDGRWASCDSRAKALVAQALGWEVIGPGFGQHRWSEH